MDATRELPVRVERLAPMRMATASVVAGDAEQQAVGRLLAWAERSGLLDRAGRRIFGFDNCLPGPDEHRYTALMPVDADVRGEGDITITELSGGLYAVATVTGAGAVHGAWAQLEAWPDAHGYRRGPGQGLEEIRSTVGAAAEDLVLDLYLPVVR